MSRRKKGKMEYGGNPFAIPHPKKTKKRLWRKRGLGEADRRRKQIEKGQLTVSNGLIRR